AQLCLPVTSTSLNPPVNCVILSGPGSLSGGQWCYTPAGDEVDVVTIRCTDALGATCSGSFTVTFDINDPPVCNVPRDTAIFQCTPAQVCLPTGATDPNGNLTGCSIISGPGTLSGGNWCYTPTGDQTVAVTVRCTDACGASCEKTFHVTFDINEAPVCSVPNDTTIFQCTPTPVCMPVSATDADGNLSGCALVNGSPGNLNGNWCYTPSGDQTVAVAIRCIDDCGAFCEKTFHVTFDVNDAPVCNLPRDTTIFQCAPAQICMPVSATDVNGNLVGCAIVNGSGTLSGGNWCYTPAGSGSVDVTIRCTDACGATCEGTFRVTFVIGQPPQITCPPDLDLACASQAPACNPNDVIVTGGTGTVTVVCNRTDNGGSGCAGSPLIYEYTYTATDSCGLTAHCKRTVTVIDNVRPHLAGCPSDVIIQCSSPVPPAANVTATDNCDQNVAIAFLETTNLHGCGGYTGTITRRWIATDHCGNADTCIQVITKVDTQAPVCSLPSGTVNFFQCTPTQISVPVSATDNCDQSVTCQVVSGLGSVYNGQWTYYPTGNASFGVTIRCSDDCGNICEGTFQVSIQINGPPTIAFGADQSIFQCSPAPICVAYSVSDPNSLNGSTESLVSGPLGASIDPANNRVCFTPSGPGTFTVIARVTDSCGSSDVDTINVNVTQNAPPTVAFGNDLTVRQCLPGPICVNYSVSDPNGIGGLSESLVSGPAGAVINTGADQVCFTPPGSGTFPIIVRVTDSCGASDQDTIVVAVIQNSAPVCSVPRDTTIFQCAPAPVCLPVSATDPDGGAVTCQKTNGPGQLSNGNWCYAPSGSQTVLVTIRCSDTCGAYCERSFSVTFTVNSPPTCSVPPDQTFHQNCVPQEVQLPVVGSDVDGNLTSCQIVSGPGHLVGSMWLYTPTDNGQVCVTIRCTDGCGATCERSFCVLFLIDKDNCGCRIEASLGDDDGTIETLNGRQVSLPVNIDSLSAEIGGFDLLICYDPSVLVFLKADIGPALDTLKWEYFTYRAGPRGNCTGGCPSGYIRLVGIANMNNMVTPPPTAYRPLGKIASLIFEVAPDRNLIGQCIPINFCWLDCGDNTFSSRSGDTTFVEQHMIIDTCQSNAKTNPIPGICFSGGWICIIEPPDDRGDINLNNIANEVGDAVLFTNYFIYGPSVWSPPYDLGQILATDVNDDGVVLTVADLIFLIRIITGDAQPYPPGGNPRLAPEARTAQVRSTVENGVLRVTSDSPVDVGGAFLTFRYSDVGPGEPVLSADAASLSIKSHAAHGELRVIAYLWERGTRLAAGAHELLGIPFTGQGQIELASVEMSDADGNVLPVRMAGGFVPKDYALLQNYPNPFNAGTVISFDLVDEADWSLSIYNILGQEVRNFTGHQTVGRVQLPWDGADRSGDAASSGIYFYRLRAGSFSATKKMLLVR
ncbi:MAG: T9SS type A sorting domain-containing protein, partial [candidate division Zixibacteria bacterium]|nr:T9SS type A sorting domain-containing protein [candidate division Zixibacteria bacterium]